MDFNPKDLEKIMMAIGALAEMSTAFYTACINCGASEEVAAAVTKVMMQTFLTLTSEENNQ